MKKITKAIGRPKVRPVPPEHSLLTVVCLDESRRPGSPAYYICLCSCGTKKSVRGDKIASGATVSCGHARQQRDFAQMARSK